LKNHVIFGVDFQVIILPTQDKVFEATLLREKFFAFSFNQDTILDKSLNTSFLFVSIVYVEI
jgi:hypothetical protein